MQLLNSFLHTTFYPTAIDFKTNTQESSQKEKFGFALGLIGFIIQGFFIFPSDEINFETDYNPLLNNIFGLLLGAVLFSLLVLFERGIARLIKNENVKNALAISYSVFGLMPLLTIPIHMIFFNELSARGHFWIVAIMIVLILAWHQYIFASVISAKENGILNKIILIFIIEIVLAFLFLIFAPIATGNSTQIFLEEYF